MNDPAYEAHLADLDAQEERARTRTARNAPHAWGDPLGAEHYFCLPCWLSGDETGAHPFDSPPCDLEPRGAFDPR